jgi:hypothetical protein
VFRLLACPLQAFGRPLNMTVSKGPFVIRNS